MTASSSDALTARQARIIKQIEYYFSDVNLMSDKFLKEKIQEDDGWVTMDNMLTFSRLKEITDNAQMICEALKKSSSGLMEVSEQGDKIRRSPSKPLPGDTKTRRRKIIARTVYAKQFPLDVKLDDLLEFFEGYGQLDTVIMNKHFQNKTFKGSAFVTFANKGHATKFVNEEETKFKEQALVVKCFKIDCLKHKAAKKEEKRKKDTDGKPHKMGEDDIKEEEAEADLEERVSQKMTKNAVLHLKGLNSKTSREQVKSFFSNVLQSDVAWVNFDKGATEGYIRLREPDSAGSTLEKAKTVNDGKVVIQGSEIEIRVVEGDEELQYWKKMFKDIADKKKSGGRGRGKSGKNQIGERNQKDGRGNSGGPQRQKGNEDSDEGDSDGEEQNTDDPQAKVIKSKMVITEQQGKRKHNKKDVLSDGEEQEKEESPPKDFKSEIVIKFQEVVKITDASCDGEEQDTEEPPAKLTKSEMVITGPQGKRKQNKKNASSDGEEQDTEEPPVKVVKSEMIIMFEEVLKFKNASCDAEEQDTEEPPARVIKSDMLIKFQEVMTLEDALNNGEEKDTEEQPANVAMTEEVITRPQGRRKQNKRHASNDGEEHDTEEPTPKVIKSEMIITRSQSKRKHNKKDVSSDGEEQDTEEPPAKVTKSEMIIRRSQGQRKRNKMHVLSDVEEEDTEDPTVIVTKSEMIMTRSHSQTNKQTNKETEDKAWFK